MPLLFAGFSALSFGIADFLGGIAAKRWPPEWVTATAQAVGLPIVFPLLLVMPGALPEAGDLGWGAVAGLTAGMGIMLLYRSLAMGPMNVAAPTAAVVATIVPVTTGLILGERPGTLALIGVACGIVAVGMVGAAAPALEGHGRRHAHALRTGLVAVGAGAGLGAAAVAFGQTAPSAGMWPLAAGRVVATALMLAMGTLRGGRTGGDRGPAVRLSVWSGLIDTGGSVFLLLALQRGLLTLVPVISSLYPAATLFLARLVLRERIGRIQAVGLGLAAVAVVLIGLS
jgi:uncharacterized membrane protein